MNLEFSEDQNFVQQTARDFLAKRAGFDVRRRVLESPELVYDRELWRGVAEMGWLGAVVPEALLRFGSEAQRRRHLTRLAAGDLVGAFAAAKGGGDAVPGEALTRFEGGRLQGEKLPVLDGGSADLCVVVARGAARPTLALVDLRGPGVVCRPLEGFDPSRPQARIAFDGAPAEALGPADGAREIRVDRDRPFREVPAGRGQR